MSPRHVHPWAFKQVMRTLVGGVTIVAAHAEAGYAGLTATAVCSLSAEPPSILVCINRSASLAQAIRPGMLFSVNILREGQEAAAHTFGGMTGTRGMARFATGNWHRSENDVPYLVDARSSIECSVEEVIERYTHLIVIATVVGVTVAHPGEPALASDDGSIASFVLQRPEVI